MSESRSSGRRTRAVLAWALTLALLGIYGSLPEGTELSFSVPPGEAATQSSDLEVVEVSPPTAAPGEAVTVRVFGADDIAKLKAFAGKQELPVLARRDDGLVVRLPTDRGARRERSASRTTVSGANPTTSSSTAPTRKAFRNLAGGLALLVFGISLFARGAREALGPASARLCGESEREHPPHLLRVCCWGAGPVDDGGSGALERPRRNRPLGRGLRCSRISRRRTRRGDRDRRHGLRGCARRTLDCRNRWRMAQRRWRPSRLGARPPGARSRPLDVRVAPLATGVRSVRFAPGALADRRPLARRRDRVSPSAPCSASSWSRRSRARLP